MRQPLNSCKTRNIILFVFVALTGIRTQAQLAPEAFVAIESPSAVHYVLSASSTRPDGAVFTYINFNTSELDVINPTLTSTGSFSGISPLTNRSVSGQIQGDSVSLTYNGIIRTGLKESVYGPTRRLAGTYVGPIFHPTAGAASLQISGSANGKVLVFSFFENLTDAGVGTIQPNGDFSVRLLSGRTASGNFAPVDGIARGNALFSTGETQTYALTKAVPGKLGNIATRGFVGSGDQVLIGGFIVTERSKGVVVTAKGPSLAARGVSNALQNPRLEIFSGSTAIAFNNSWTANANASQISASGVAPTDNREAALQLNLEAGAYTAVVSSEDGSTGIGLVEVYAVGNPLGD